MPPRRDNAAAEEQRIAEMAALRQQVDSLTTALEEMRLQLATQNHSGRNPARTGPGAAQYGRGNGRGGRGRDLPGGYHPPTPSGFSDDEDTHSMVNPFAPLAPQHDHSDMDDRRWEMGFKMEIPEFTGALDASAFMDWINSVEELLEFKVVPDHRRVPLVATRFRGRASAWWQQIKFTRQRQGKSKIQSWNKFRKHLEREFLPFNYTRTLYQRLQHLRQGSRTVDAYTEEFYQLVARSNLHESVDQLISRYIGGLRLSLQDTLNLFSPLSVSEAHQRAVLLKQ